MSCVTLSLLTSCAHEGRPAIDVAPTLLARTETPTAPTGDYMQDEAAVYVLGLKKAVAQCNIDKDTLREVLKPLISQGASGRS